MNIFKHKAYILIVAFAMAAGAVLLCNIRGFNKGIDFTGGVVVEVACENCDANAIGTSLEQLVHSSVSHQKIDGGYIFKMPSVNGDYEQTIASAKDIVAKGGATVTRTDFASPRITQSFMKDSVAACIFAFVCIGIYILVRFDIKFAIAGITSLVFDTIIVLACISMLNIEFSLTTLTALLTIIGYCINDKIVIFDRVRTNLPTSDNMPEVVLTSVKSTFVRSVLTSATTAIATTSLLFFGDRPISELGITINCGIFIGTISSLVFAPSVLLALGLKRKLPKPEKSPMFYAS